MNAPAGVNLDAQNDGVERFIRASAASGVEVSVDTCAFGRRLVVPLSDGTTEHVDILTRVEYWITGTTGGDPVNYHVIIEVTPPPNGRARIVENTIPPDAPGGDVLARLGH